MFRYVTKCKKEKNDKKSISTYSLEDLASAFTEVSPLIVSLSLSFR